MQGDQFYFSRRGSEDRKAAEKVADPRARQAYLDLALRYDDLAAALEPARDSSLSDVA